jgi:hypothetical protein
MKSFSVRVLLVIVFSSCVTYKNLTKREAITHELLAGLKEDEKYIFELRNGTRQVVKVVQVKDSVITGLFLDKNGTGKNWNDYSATFDTMQREVVKISMAKFNPYVTGAGILAFALVATVVIWANTAW